MTDEKPRYSMSAEPAVPALWFTSSGCGPNGFELKLRGFPSEIGEPVALGIQLAASADGIIIGGEVAAMIGGGFYLHREQVAELHRQFGVWLADNPVADTSDTSETERTTR